MLPKSSKGILLDHIEHVKASVKLKSKNDQLNADFLEKELRIRAKRHTILGRTRLIVFAFLYASFLTTFSVDYPLLSDVLQTLITIGGIIGIGVLSAAVLLISYRMRELWNGMIIYYSHLIAIYEKNNTAIYKKEDMPENKA